MSVTTTPTRTQRPSQVAPSTPSGWAARLRGVGRVRWGQVMIGAAALASVIAPILTDAILLGPAHMGNPAWLPHAKLHCAMSFFAAAFLGGAGLAVIIAKPATDRFSMVLATVLSSSFGVGLIAAGFWPGTSYRFLDDPVYGNDLPPQVLGIDVYPNVVLAGAVVVVAVVGLGLILSRVSPRR